MLQFRNWHDLCVGSVRSGVLLLITRKDDGGSRLAYSRLLGVFGGALISRTWQPEESRTVNNGLTNGAISLGWDIGNKMFEEFWPDIRKRLRH